MKQIVIIMGLSVVVILTSMILLSAETKSDRKDELNRAVSAAVKQTVSVSQIEDQKEITCNDEMVANFIQLMSTNINSDGDISIDVMGVDYENGMLDVLVTETFQYINGKTDTISIRKCAVYD